MAPVGRTRGARKVSVPSFPLDQVVRLWFHRQGLSALRGSSKLGKRTLTAHLEKTGGLQLDSVNVVDRAHYLKLWSRFWAYDRKRLDRWMYQERAGFDYWGHEASIRPISHLPLGRRRMKNFPPESWSGKSWWSLYDTSTSSRRRVLRRLRHEGPLESVDFEKRPGDGTDPRGGGLQLPKEDKRSLKLLWHHGRVGIRTRRHFRCVYDLAERVYPPGPIASTAALEDSWLLIGLTGNGVASERHLANYFTAPDLNAADRKKVIQRNLQTGRIVEVRVEDVSGRFFALPEHLEGMEALPEPQGTTLICPFDSLLWQRRRAEEFLDFHYRIEIYVPEARRQFGYYVLPILHNGRLVGRLDPKLHRDRSELQIKAIYLEDGFKRDPTFDRGLAETLESLRGQLSAERLQLPKGWRRLG